MDPADSEKFTKGKTTGELLAVLERPDNWHANVVDAARAELGKRGVDAAVAVAAAPAAGKPQSLTAPLTIAVTTDRGIYQYRHEVPENAAPHLTDAAVNETVAELRTEILKGTIPKDSKATFEYKTPRAKPRTMEGTVIRRGFRYSALGNLYTPVRRHARTGLQYGMMMGALAHIALLGVLTYQSKEELGMAIVALPVCFIVGGLSVSRKVKMPQIIETVCLLGASLALPIYLGLNGLFPALLGAAFSGAVLWAMPGMAIGAIAGAIRRGRLPRAYDAPRENAALQIVVPLIAGVAVWAGYVQLSRAVLPGLLGSTKATTARITLSDVSSKIYQRETAVAEYLLKDHPEFCSGTDGNGETLLHAAARVNDLQIAQYLVAHGADVNAKDRQGWTPLHWAVASREETFATWLLANHADVNAKDKDGRTPMSWAVIRDYKDMAELLRQHGGHE